MCVCEDICLLEGGGVMPVPSKTPPSGRLLHPLPMCSQSIPGIVNCAVEHVTAPTSWKTVLSESPARIERRRTAEQKTAASVPTKASLMGGSTPGGISTWWGVSTPGGASTEGGASTWGGLCSPVGSPPGVSILGAR